MPETEWHKWASALMQGSFTVIVLNPALGNYARSPVCQRAGSLSRAAALVEQSPLLAV
ncbi:MAG: hypothetical protein NDI93_05480 [Pseudomonas sp.]|nr:hypothetical protein [Pseudomonas sp.]